MHSGRLLASFEAGSDFVSAGDGAPIWPIRSPFDAMALSSVAELFGIRVELCAPSHTGARVDSEELVVSIGEETSEAGALYAHLTGRRAISVKDPEFLGDHEGVAVVVATPEQVTTRVLEDLTSGARGFMPGLICAERHLLRSHALASAAATRGFVQAPARHRIDVRPLSSIGHLVLPDREVLGSRAEGRAFRAAFARGAGVLSLQTHSDGFDALLSPDLTLCTMDMPHAVQWGVPNLCAETGHCHRYDEPTSVAVKGGRAVFPGDIAARILVLDCCSGLMTADSVGDPCLGLSARLAENPRIGLLITAWEIAFPSPELLEELVSHLCMGVSAGEAVFAFNQSPYARKAGQRLCIVGDPRVRLPNPPAPAYLAALEARAEPPSRELSELGLLTLVASSLKGSPRHERGPAKAAAQRFEQALQERVLMTCAGWHSQARARATAHALRLACLDSLCEGPNVPPISSTWLTASRMCEPTGEAPILCPACGECSAASLVAEAQVDPPYARRIRHCPRCGVVEDAPLSDALSVSWRGHVATLSGELPCEAWAARLLAISKRRPASRWWDWPAASDGRPVRSFSPTSGWPPGLGYVSLLFMRELALTAFSKQMRFPAPADGEARR